MPGVGLTENNEHMPAFFRTYADESRENHEGGLPLDFKHDESRAREAEMTGLFFSAVVAMAGKRLEQQARQGGIARRLTQQIRTQCEM